MILTTVTARLENPKMAEKPQRSVTRQLIRLAIQSVMVLVAGLALVALLTKPVKKLAMASAWHQEDAARRAMNKAADNVDNAIKTYQQMSEAQSKSTERTLAYMEVEFAKKAFDNTAEAAKKAIKTVESASDHFDNNARIFKTIALCLWGFVVGWRALKIL